MIKNSSVHQAQSCLGVWSVIKDLGNIFCENNGKELNELLPLSLVNKLLYCVVTLLARFRGWSTLNPLSTVR